MRLVSQSRKAHEADLVRLVRLNVIRLKLKLYTTLSQVEGDVLPEYDPDSLVRRLLIRLTEACSNVFFNDTKSRLLVTPH